MALNYPGPYEVRIQYIVSVSGVSLSHEQRLNVDLVTPVPVAEPFTTIVANERDGGTNSLEAWVDTWVAALQPHFHTSATISLAELWKYEPFSFEASYVSTYDISLAGTSGAAPVPAGQAIWAFRTVEGGIMKINLMECSIQSGVSRAYVAMSAIEKAIVDLIVGGNNCWLGRDTSYPFAVTQLHPGANEALYRKRYRSS